MRKKKERFDPFDRSYFQIVDMNLEEWCKEHHLEVKEKSCGDCGDLIRTTIPAFGKGWRGLVAAPCSCGKENSFKHCRVIGELPSFIQTLNDYF